MWDEISHHYKLRELQRKQKRANDSDSNRIEKARKGGADRCDLDELKHEARTIDLYFDDQIRALQSRYLIKQAERYLLPTPPFDKESGNWEESDVTVRWRLTLPAQAALRSAIYDYEKVRRERIQSWLVVVSGIIGACTGLLGALIGLVAISS